MSSSEEKVKQANKKREMDLFIQLAGNKKRSEAEDIEYARLLQLYGQEAIKDPTLLKNKDDVYVALDGANKHLKAKNDFDALIKAYTDKTGNEPIQTEHGKLLHFNSKAEAVEFFKEQSTTLAFDMYNKMTDHRVYSDGKGTFVHGTEKQVSDYLLNPKDFKLGEDGKLDKKDDLEMSESPRCSS